MRQIEKLTAPKAGLRIDRALEIGAQNLSGKNEPQDQEFDQVSLRLNNSLKSCRAVLLGYRALLSSGQGKQTSQEGSYPASCDIVMDISSAEPPE